MSMLAGYSVNTFVRNDTHAGNLVLTTTSQKKKIRKDMFQERHLKQYKTKVTAMIICRMEYRER